MLEIMAKSSKYIAIIGRSIENGVIRHTIGGGTTTILVRHLEVGPPVGCYFLLLAFAAACSMVYVFIYRQVVQVAAFCIT